MSRKGRKFANYVVGPDGGLLSLDEACQRYSLSVEEFLSWQRAFDRFGQRGLRATKADQKRVPMQPHAA
jgi:hypothetical protein